jgi:transposase InsO family protein
MKKRRKHYTPEEKVTILRRHLVDGVPISDLCDELGLQPILDRFSRKVVGWALDRTLGNRLAVGALEQALEKRQPPPGLVHHSDRGLQYASAEYATVLEKHRMVPSMSRPANDNASCESFMKTLKREEIYANKYDDLEHLRVNIEEFIEEYYNRQRLHSALGYRTPEEYFGRFW